MTNTAENPGQAENAAAPARVAPAEAAKPTTKTAAKTPAVTPATPKAGISPAVEKKDGPTQVHVSPPQSPTTKTEPLSVIEAMSRITVVA